MGEPAVDVVVPAYNEERHIERCLDAVLAQDYPSERTRVVVVEAGSTDATPALLAERARAEPRISVVGDGRRLSTPEALNTGIEAGSGELVARVDAHGWPRRDFVRRAVEAFGSEGEDVACVGGRATPLGETPFGRALAVAWTSRFGVGGSVYASDAERASVSTVPWGMYRRGPLEEVGLFDPSMNYGEDEELNWRLRKAGYRVLLDGSISFSYVPRGSWLGAFRQYRNYGRARVRVVRAHPDFLRVHHLAPAGLVGALAALAGAAPLSRRARLALAGLGGAYLTASAAAALDAAREGEEPAPLVAAAFWALHLGYGVGMLEELAKDGGAGPS